MLRQLEAIGIVPGAVVRVDEGGAGVGALALTIGDETVALGYDVAHLVWAEPV